MIYPRLTKPESIANAQSEIQIVDTHWPSKTRIVIGFEAGVSQFNRTLVISHTYIKTCFFQTKIL
jgi:hypothetical protein